MGRCSKGRPDDTFSYVASLKHCAQKKDLSGGLKLHAQVRASGLLAQNAHLGSTLISMYAKCGALPKAQEVFLELPVRDLCTWNALLAGFAQHGLGKEALDCFSQMRCAGLSPDAFTYACTLKVCGMTKQAGLGKKIHNEIVSQGLFGNIVLLGNALVDMYAKCGMLETARQLLEKLPNRNVVSWSALIAGYVCQGQSKEAIICYDQMRQEGLSPDVITYTCVLKACGMAEDVVKGKQIHEEIVGCGLLGKDVVLGTALVVMYAECGVLTKAQEALDNVWARDVVAWTTLIAGYVQQGQCEKAMVCYDQMQREGLSPNAVTYTCILKACGIAKEVEKGKQIHQEIDSQGLLRKDVVLGNALVDMYAKCGLLSKAQEVLDMLHIRDVVSWTALMAGYGQQGQSEKVMACYYEMRREGISPNTVTYACILQACGIGKEVEKGKQIHEEIASQGLMGKEAMLGTVVVDMYSKCGVLDKAQLVLDELPVQDVVSWNALIAGYTQQEQGEKALVCFEKMRHGGISPNTITYVCILKACGIAKDVEKGKQVHEEIAHQALLGKYVMLGTALVDMYAKCGVLSRAKQVFDELPVRDAISWSTLLAGYAREGRCEDTKDCFDRMQSEGLVPSTVPWTTLIGGYAEQGESEKALSCFWQMQHKGISPDTVTLVCVLNACTHLGLVDEGQMLFENMEEKFGITPDIEHHTSMVHLFSRAGHFGKAMAVIKKLPPSNPLAVWPMLLAACRRWGNTNLGRLAFERALQIDEQDAAACLYGISRCRDLHVY